MERFVESCEKKLDHIIDEIETLKVDMTEKYRKIGFQFKILAVTLGACIGITLSQLLQAAFRL